MQQKKQYKSMSRLNLLPLLAVWTLWLPTARAQEAPTATPKMVVETPDGNEEKEEHSGSAPIVAHFTANAEYDVDWTPLYEWRVYEVGKEDSPYLVRYDADFDYTFVKAGTSCIVLKISFVNGNDTTEYAMETPFKAYDGNEPCIFVSYSHSDRDAVFKCRVNSISEHQLPEFDDDFVQDVSEFDTVEEYKADVEKKIRERKEKAQKAENETAAVRAAVKNATMDIPDAMLDEQARNLVNEFAQRIQSQGMNMQQYMQITGMNEETLVQQMRPQALERIQNSLFLEAVAKEENIEISDERLDEEVEKMAESYNMEKEKLYELMGEESKTQMKQDLAVQEAVKVIAENAVEVDMPEEEPADPEETPEEN